MWIKQVSEAGQYVDTAGVRCDLISADNVALAAEHPEYSDCELLADAMEALGLSLYRSGPKRYSKLRIIEELGEAWFSIESGMGALELRKFNAASYLERGNEDFEAFLAKLAPTMPELDAMLAKCEI